MHSETGKRNRETAESERLVKFTLLGQNYSFYTGASEEEMRKILHLVNTLIEESTPKTAGGSIPVSKTAIMACLNIASRYIRLQQDFAEYRSENDARVARLIEQIDAGLLVEKKDGNV
ncbi:MAG: cell division protein ZapA [Desulfopila sp.]|jgi:cell division protein ZapA|nr:cell division protein ZapA [Desulfopila sp.]